MNIEALKKIATPSAQEICALAAAGGYPLDCRDDLHPVGYVNQLLAADRVEATLQFLAFALPPREAVWWGCSCARAGSEDEMAAPLIDAVEAAENWVRKPTDEHRRVAMVKAQATDFKSPAAWAAIAAFWSGGSLAPEGLPEVPAPPHLLGCAVAAAVLLAAVKADVRHAEVRRRRFLAAAIDIANGGNGRKLKEPVSTSS